MRYKPTSYFHTTRTRVSILEDKVDILEGASSFSGSYNDLTDKPALFDGSWASLSGKPALFDGSWASLSGKPTLFDGSWASLSGKPTLFDGAWSSLSGKPSTFTPSTHSHAISDVPGLQTALDGKQAAGSYADATHTHTASDITNFNSAVDARIPTRSFSQPSRTSGTAFQVSVTRDSQVTYTASIQCSALLLTGSAGTMTLQYADNVGMTTNLVTLPPDSFGLPAGLVVSVNGTMRVTGLIPAGKYVRVTTAASAGSPTIGSLSSQEVLL